MNFCCLCLFERKNCLNIFDRHNSTLSSYNNLYVLIAKYFWFEPQENAFKSKFICCDCWDIIKNFHELYIKVEEIHNINNIVDVPLLDRILQTENKNSLDFIKQERNELDLYIPDVENENIERGENIDIIDSNENIKVIKDEDNLMGSTNRRRTRSKNYKIIKTDIEDINKNVISDAENENIEKDENLDLMDSNYENIKDEKNLIGLRKRKTTRSKKHINENDTVQIKIASKGHPRSKISERAKQSHECDKKVSSFMTLTCDLCSDVISTFGKLKTHFQKVHNLNGYAVCCNRKHYKRNLLIDHIDTHLNPDHFKCPTCSKTFTNKESHQTHVKTFHLPERVVYECDECPKKFSWRYVLLAHKKTHAPKEEWKYKCKDCDKTFASHTFLSSHKHYVHKVTKKICDLCGKSVSNTSFRKHQLKHSGIVQPKIQCEICGSWLNKKYIKIHLKNHEESGIDHICIHCGKKSPNSKALYKHIYEVHTLKKTLKCNVCEKTFKSKDLLTQHMPVHTGENNFSCQYCPRTFKFKSNWHDHKKKEHPLEFEEERQKRLFKMNLNNGDANDIIKLSESTVGDSFKI